MKVLVVIQEGKVLHPGMEVVSPFGLKEFTVRQAMPAQQKMVIIIDISSDDIPRLVQFAQ